MATAVTMPALLMVAKVVFKLDQAPPVLPELRRVVVSPVHSTLRPAMAPALANGAMVSTAEVVSEPQLLVML